MTREPSAAHIDAARDYLFSTGSTNTEADANKLLLAEFIAKHLPHGPKDVDALLEHVGYAVHDLRSAINGPIDRTAERVSGVIASLAAVLKPFDTDQEASEANEPEGANAD